MSKGWRRTLAALLCLVMMLALVPSIATTSAATVSSKTAEEVVAFLEEDMKYHSKDYGANQCLKYISDVYGKMGFDTRYNLGSAIKYWSILKDEGKAHYDSLANVPVGADVFFDFPTYGHVGIYVGDGYIIHNRTLSSGDYGVIKQKVSDNDYYMNNYLGWAWHDWVTVVNTATLDINGYLDGQSVSDTAGYGTFDIYIGGTRVAAGVSEYRNTDLTVGEQYAIKNVKAANGKAFAGILAGGDYTGPLVSNTVIALTFRTINPSSWVNSHSAQNTQTYNNHIYKYYADKVTWKEANSYCNEMGGHLVWIGDAAESQFVHELAGQSTVWIGAHDTNREGTFTWTNGEAISYANWLTGEPNNDTANMEGGEDYVHMYGTEYGLHGEWNDACSYLQYGFVCEFDNYTVTVTYDANGGTNPPSQQTKTKGQTLTLSSAEPIRARSTDGSYTVTLDPNGGKVDNAALTATRTTVYTFKNWNTKKDGTGTAYAPGASYTTDASMTLYAQWTSVSSTSSVTLPTPTRANSTGSYTVTLDPNGGSVSTTSLSAARTTSYTFKNWNTKKDGTGTAFPSGGSYVTNADETLYAQWTGSTSTASVTLPTPWRYGYTFKGWGTSGTASSGVTGSYKPGGNVTLYAIWEKEDLSGWSTSRPDNIYADMVETATQYRYADRAVTGGWTQSGSGAIDYVESWSPYFDTAHSLYSQYNKTPKAVGTTGSTKVEATTAVRGYLYWHWCRGQSKDAPTNRFISDDGYTAEFNTFHAFFSTSGAEHTDGKVDGGECFYYPNAGCCTDTYWWWRTPVYRQTYTEYTATSSYGDWSAWSDWTMTRYETGETRKEESRTVYRYKDSVKPITVAFDPMGGACDTESKSVILGEIYKALPTATRSGCTFVGWFTAPVGGDRVTETTRVTTGGTHVLYAHWTDFAVVYDANGGGGAPAQQTKKAGQPLTLSTVQPSRSRVAAGSVIVTLNANGGTVSKTSLTAARTTRYTFHCWNTKKDGSGKGYVSGASYTIDAPLILYAQWTETTAAEAVILPVATLDGSAFDGWYTAATGGNRAGGAGDSYTPTGPITLYAHFVKNHTHTPGQPVRENEVAATCTAEGGYDEVVYCTGCGEELSRTHKTIAKLGHNPGAAVRENEVAATCTAAGSYDEVVYCTGCGEELSRTHKTIAKLGHNPGAAVRENEVPATCTAAGGYDEVVYCTRCGLELSRTHTTVAKLGHLPGEPVRENVDEVAKTYDEVVYCQRCGLELSRVRKALIKTLGSMTITGEPQNVTVNVGEKAFFVVNATGAKTYQWYYRTSEERPWVKAKSGTKAILTVAAKATDNRNQYRCEVKSADGSLYSDVVTLTVVDSPAIKTQPKSVKVKSGAVAKFSVKATGSSLTYQWYSRAAGSNEWTAISGATKVNYSFTTTKADNGRQLRCRVKNGDGEVYSSAVTLTVTAQPATVKTQPKAVKVKSGAKAKFTVKAAGPNLNYQWYGYASSGDQWTAIDGATKAEYSFTTVKADDGKQFRCRVWNSDGEAYSVAATLTVTAQPATIKTQPKDAKAKVGAKAKFAVKAAGPNLKYQWYTRVSGADEWTAIKGANAASYTVVTSSANGGWQFRCRVWNDDGEVYSKAVTLTLK